MAESWRKSISDGVNIYSKRGDEAGFTLLHRDNESSYTDDRPLLVAGKPELREYKAVRVRRGRDWLVQR